MVVFVTNSIHHQKCKFVTAQVNVNVKIDFVNSKIPINYFGKNGVQSIE